MSASEKIGKGCCTPARGEKSASETHIVTSSEGGVNLREDMIALPGARFLMGTDYEHAFPQDGEGPVREITVDAFEIYRCLRVLNPSPYMFYLNFNGLQLVGASPELLVRAEDGLVETRPIAGTRPRGKNDEEDDEFVKSLLADPKEKAEHIMLVDLGRNDVGRSIEPDRASA